MKPDARNLLFKAKEGINALFRSREIFLRLVQLLGEFIMFIRVIQ